ncbi:hypothetical protein CERSUDRAFT_71706 [Gelatoporia subvermispora B]|uniref:Uncharacterized protein n=1 Tax=Ceriporiopsis subvermispora (strain B) TaxID=914234 RepID=M2PT31_CERS8|nr:hypothetical protein CERSUDRAFT_71706 [Gelatoporia subvermispora B]
MPCFDHMGTTSEPSAFQTGSPRNSSADTLEGPPPYIRLPSIVVGNHKCNKMTFSACTTAELLVQWIVLRKREYAAWATQLQLESRFFVQAKSHLQAESKEDSAFSAITRTIKNVKEAQLRANAANEQRRDLEAELQKRCIDHHEEQAASIAVMALYTAVTSTSNTSPAKNSGAEARDGDIPALLELMFWSSEHLRNSSPKAILDEHENKLRAKVSMSAAGAVSSLFHRTFGLRCKSAQHQVANLLRDLHQAGQSLTRCIRPGREEARRNPESEKHNRNLLSPVGTRRRLSMLEELHVDSKSKVEVLSNSEIPIRGSSPLEEGITARTNGTRIKGHSTWSIQITLHRANLLKKAEGLCVAWKSAHIVMLNFSEPTCLCLNHWYSAQGKYPYVPTYYDSCF